MKPSATNLAANESLLVVYIEDDAKLARLTATYLQARDVRVVIASNPRDGLVCVTREQPDVILLDLMLPGMDGFEVCRLLRERVDTPIIMVTARDDEADRVMGLEGGADDYVTKPFSSRELLARVRAHARRARGRVGPRRVQTAGPLCVNPSTRDATMNGEPLALTAYEFDLLQAFVERPGRVLTREQLVDLVHGTAGRALERSIDVHISHLRQKLRDKARRAQLLKTVRGVGYILVVDGD